MSLWLKPAHPGNGVDNLPITVVPHPLGGIDPQLAAAKADAAIDAVIEKATQCMPRSSFSMTDPYPAEMVTVKDSLEAVNEMFWTNAWCDGFPIIPPTRERVDAMLSATTRQPDHIVGLIPPRMGAATVQMIAINAVMAGAKPEHLPVVIASVEAALKPEAELRRWQSTTRPSFLTAFVQGPMVKTLGIHSGQSALFPGPKPNAVIGRAFLLTIRLLGGVTSPPGKIGTMTTLGLPIYSACLGENEDALPQGLGPLESGIRLWPG